MSILSTTDIFIQHLLGTNYMPNILLYTVYLLYTNINKTGLLLIEIENQVNAINYYRSYKSYIQTT